MTDTVQKVAIVTGASVGLGQAVTKRLAKDGFAVALQYAGCSEKAESLARELESEGARTITLQADVANENEVGNLFEQAAEAFGRIDVVVHADGIMPLFPIESGDVKSFDKVISRNLRGTFLVMARAAQWLPSGGRIIVFSSSVVAKSFPNYGGYIASKAGVEGLVHVLANELRRRNITVNAVAPGPVATDLFRHGRSEAQISELSKLAPLGRLSEPEDIAGIVSFLAGPDGLWINSQVLQVQWWIQQLVCPFTQAKETEGVLMPQQVI